MFSRFLLGLCLGTLAGSGAAVFFFSSRGGDYLIATSPRVQRLERDLRTLERQRSSLPQRLERVLHEIEGRWTDSERLEARLASLKECPAKPTAAAAAPRPEAPVIEPETPAAQPQAPLGRPEAPAVEAAAPPPQPAPSAPAASAGDVPHRLRIEATERAWIHAVIDGEQEKDVILEPGRVVEWTAHEGFVVTLGNAGGVSMSIDGKNLPALGVSGQVVRDLRLPPPAEPD